VRWCERERQRSHFERKVLVRIWQARIWVRREVLLDTLDETFANAMLKGAKTVLLPTAGPAGRAAPFGRISDC